MNLKFSWIVFLMWMLFKKIKRKKGHLHVQNFIRMNHLPCRTVKADLLDAFCIFFLSTWTHLLPASCKDCCIMFLLHLLNGFGISFEKAFVLYVLRFEICLKQYLFLDPLTSKVFSGGIKRLILTGNKLEVSVPIILNNFWSCSDQH